MTAPKKRPASAKKEAKPKEAKIRVRVDPLKEFAEAMKEQGIAEVSHLSNDEALPNVLGRVSTGSLALDSVLRNPMEPKEQAGIPLGRVTEMYGPPFIGKSTLLDHILANVQKIGGVAVLADTEISRDRHYTQRLGVDLTKLQYLEFERDQMYLENVIQAIYGAIDFWGDKHPETPVVIGLDALGGTATHEELEKGMATGEKKVQPGLAARVMHQAARLLPRRLAGRRIGLVILNHEYEKIGGFGGGFGQGPRRETYGGSGVRHVGSTRLQLYSGGVYIKRSDGTYLGKEVGVKLVKNRLGDSQCEVRVPILNGMGVENVYTLFEDLRDAKIIATSGAWSAINLDGQVLKFMGWSGLKDRCKEDPTLFDRLVFVWKKVKYADLYVSVPKVLEGSGTGGEVRGTGQPADA